MNNFFINPFLILAVVVLVAISVIVAIGYVKAPPDRAFIISGLTREPKIIVGGSALVLAVAGLSLLLMDLVVVRWILAVGAAVLLVVTEERKIGFSKKILKKFRRK